MEYILEITTNCGCNTTKTRHATFTDAFNACQHLREDTEVDIYITPTDGKFLYEKLAYSELFVAERDRADFDEIVNCVKASKGTYPSCELHIH